MSDLLPENPPSPENGYTVTVTMTITAALFNHILGSIHGRLAALEALEADFEQLIADGTSAALTMIQENIAPQIYGLQQSVLEAQDAVADLLATGTAPNAAKLGNQLPAYYLAPANFAVSATVKTLLAAADAVGVHDAIGTGALLSVKANSSRLDNAGIAGNARIVPNANDAPLGTMLYFTGVDSVCVAANYPTLGSEATRHWNVLTFGQTTRTTQIAQEVFGLGSFKGRTFRRVRHDANWSPWLELATMDKVLALTGGAMSGDLRLDGGIGIGMAPPQAGGLYFHRANGNPFIVFLGDANNTETPVQLAQIRVEQTSNVLRLTNAGLSTMVSFNLTNRLGEVAGNPTAPLGIATKGYVDAAIGGVNTALAEKIGVYTGSDRDETNFPVGHYVGLVTQEIHRNASTVVTFHPGSGSQPYNYLAGTYGSRTLAGTWRVRGTGLAQRVS